MKGKVTGFFLAAKGKLAAAKLGVVGFFAAAKKKLLVAIAVMKKKLLLFIGPKGWIILAIVALVVLIVKNWDKIRDFAIKAWEKIRDNALKVWNKIRDFAVNTWKSIKNIFGAAPGWFKDIFRRAGDGIKSIFKGVFNTVVSLFEGVVNRIIGGINGLTSKLSRALSFSLPDWVPGIGGRSLNINIPQVPELRLPRLATGGIVDGATIAMIGEAGPEAVVPLSKNSAWMEPLYRIWEAMEISNSLMREMIVAITGNKDIYIDGKLITDFVLGRIKSTQMQTGKGLLRI
jgi:hypothetical protein